MMKNLVIMVMSVQMLLSSSSWASEASEVVRTMEHQVGDHRLTYILQVPEGEAPKDGWPLLLFLHGYGECGDEIDKVRKHGPPKLIATVPQLQKCIVVSPQCPKNSWWRIAALKELIVEVRRIHGHVDSQRIYITGLSMGGYGTWSFLSHYSDLVAAAVPICGGGDPFRLPKNRPPVKEGITNEFDPEGLKGAIDVPIWTFHGSDDGSVPLEETERLVKLLRESGHANVRFTVYPGAGHVDSWKKAYADPKLWEWLFAQRRK